MECGECEWNVYHGHAPDCSRRCQVVDETAFEIQCDFRAHHKGVHGIYGPDEDDGVVMTWPARLGEPVRQ